MKSQYSRSRGRADQLGWILASRMFTLAVSDMQFRAFCNLLSDFAFSCSDDLKTITFSSCDVELWSHDIDELGLGIFKLNKPAKYQAHVKGKGKGSPHSIT